MIKLLTLGLMTAAFAMTMMAGHSAHAQDKAGPQLAHMVFFTLKDHSEASREQFVKSCQDYLAEIEGTVYFSVGVIAEDVEEPGVSVKDFDVALHAVFKNKAAKEAYLVHPQHKAFVEKNREQFAKVRVFDSYLASPK